MSPKILWPVCCGYLLTHGVIGMNKLLSGIICCNQWYFNHEQAFAIRYGGVVTHGLLGRNTSELNVVGLQGLMMFSVCMDLHVFVMILGGEVLTFEKINMLFWVD